ncbi:MAG: hypothetical protein JW984_13865 [Deltaproteobacteria bacterium]|uniref:Nucleotide modification associated domain-containing protein n=1 Tax=Candidatus Zymogenus saltonus TaxID=2844893 RepID=A0A9D8PRL9_9DELT|nr:hypothetical protein [Candidatus Zymogenus saltonus]
MKEGLLVRVGIDGTSKSGKWNAPVDTETGRFLYIPILEGENAIFKEGLERKYDELIPEVKKFYQDCGCVFGFPDRLYDQSMHLDPDFENLTYGDQGKKGARIYKMNPGDFLVFYAGLRSIDSSHRELVYAIIGIYIIDKKMEAESVIKDHWHENAHTRRTIIKAGDIIVKAKKGVSGRLERCIPIGEWRENAYRVKEDILEKWGGISAKNGYIQRSGTLPHFKNPERFYAWFKKQNVRLIKRNVCN